MSAPRSTISDMSQRDDDGEDSTPSGGHKSEIGDTEPERHAISLDELRAKAEIEEQRRGFTFKELRENAHDEAWLDAHPGAREQIAQLGETVRKFKESFKLAESTRKTILDSFQTPPVIPKRAVRSIQPEDDFLKGVAGRPRPPAPIELADVPPHPSHKTNDLLAQQVEVLQGLVLAQDEQLRLQKDEAEADEKRASDQAILNWLILGVAVLTLMATLAGFWVNG